MGHMNCTEMIFDECVVLLREIFRNNFVESVDFLDNFYVNLEQEEFLPLVKKTVVTNSSRMHPNGTKNYQMIAAGPTTPNMHECKCNLKCNFWKKFILPLKQIWEQGSQLKDFRG